MIPRPAMMAGVERYLLVALGGALGSILRYGAAMYAGANWRTTMAVNLSGAFLIGLLASSAWAGDARIRLLVASGFLGGYTTFSTWQLEALLSLREGNLPEAIWNLAGGTALGLIAVLLGFWIGGRLR